MDQKNNNNTKEQQATPTDEAILSQQREIEKEVRETQKQIGDLEEPKVLLEEYKDNKVFLQYHLH